MEFKQFCELHVCQHFVLVISKLQNSHKVFIPFSCALPMEYSTPNGKLARNYTNTY